MRKRSKLGPTRYVARCVSRVRLGKQPCWNPLPLGRHVGICDRCRDMHLLPRALRGQR